MKTNYWLVIVATFLFATATFGQTSKTIKETPIWQDEVPQVVLDAFKAAYPDAKARGHVRIEMDGEEFYKIKSVEGKARRDISYDKSGALTKIEDILDVADLPANVQSTIGQKYPDGKVSFAERVNQNNQTRYEVNVQRGEKLTRMIFDSAGTLVSANDVIVTYVMHRIPNY